MKRLLPQILKNATDSEIKDAIEYNWYEFIKSWSELGIEGFEHEESELFYEFKSGIPYFRLNGVLDTHFPPEVVEKSVKKVATAFKERKLPFIWIIGPSSNPVNLKEYLLKNDLTYIVKPPGMAFDLNLLPDKVNYIPDVEIIPVHNQETTETYLDVGLTGLEWDRETTYNFLLDVATRFSYGNNPHHSAFIAYYKGKPVAISRVFYGAGVAGVYRVTTLEEARHKGIGTAISLAPLYEAKELGYEIATLVSTDMGFNVYKRIGFSTYCEFEIYGWSPVSNEVFSVLIH